MPEALTDSSVALLPQAAALSALGIAVRPRVDADEDALRAIYIAARWEEPGLLAWPEAMRRSFLTDQQRFQRRHYDATYPDAAWGVVEIDRQVAGLLSLWRGEGELRVVDVALLPPWRGRGLGTALLRAVRDRARALGLSAVGLSVAVGNPAAGLYQRLGFQVVAFDGMYHRLIWPVD